MEELKPCPFCGREAQRAWRSDPLYEDVCVYVECHACGARSNEFTAYGDPDTEEFWKQRAVYQATDAWNRRA